MTGFGIIYCPMFEELKQIQQFFPLEEDFTEKFGFLVYRSKVNGIDLLVTSKDDMGVSTANTTIRKIRSEFEVRFAVCIGIAGALSDDVELGDVCFTQEVIDINENQKVESGKTQYNPKFYGSNNAIDAKVGLSEVHPSLVQFHSQWAIDAELHAKSILKDLPEEIWIDRRLKPIAKKGAIICGPVVADPKLKTRLKNIKRKVLAVETESGGVYQGFDVGDKFEVLVVRGISDMADDTKKVTEVAGKSAFREIAARNAAAFLRMQLEQNTPARNQVFPCLQRAHVPVWYWMRYNDSGERLAIKKVHLDHCRGTTAYPVASGDYRCVYR